MVGDGVGEAVSTGAVGMGVAAVRAGVAVAVGAVVREGVAVTAGDGDP